MNFEEFEQVLADHDVIAASACLARIHEAWDSLDESEQLYVKELESIYVSMVKAELGQIF